VDGAEPDDGSGTAGPPPGLSPTVAVWEAERLTFPLQRGPLTASALGALAFSALCAVWIPLASRSPAPSGRTRFGLPAEVLLGGCALFFAAIAVWAVSILVRNRPVLVADATGVTQGERVIRWEDIVSVGAAESELVGMPTRSLAINPAWGERILVGRRRLGCSIEGAYELIDGWASEHVDVEVPRFRDPAAHRTAGAEVLDEVFRSMEASPGTGDPPSAEPEPRR
jgi:hypothetical protein